MAKMSQTELIRLFIDEGIEEGVAGNGCVKNNQFIHYFTPICERYNDKFILNHCYYSLATEQLQKKIKRSISSDKIIEVGGVPEGYKGSLKEFIK